MKRGIVVYGSGPQDTDELTPVERLNIGAALKLFCQRREKATFILTGGKTGKSQFSEAEVMAVRLICSGIPEECIRLEKEAANTVENVAFVSNLVDKMGFKHLFHVAPRVHLPRVKELCWLVGIDWFSDYKSSEEILGDKHPAVKTAIETLQRIAVNEPKWMRGLKEIPLYWLPQMAKVENLQRFRYILGHERIKRWLGKNFSVCKVKDLTDREIGEIREKIKKMERVMF